MTPRIGSIWIYLTLFFFLAVASPAWAVKPRPPLALFLQQTENSNEGTRIVLNATANVDISRVELSVELAPGLSLVKGDQEWAGPLKKGETQQVEFVVQSRGNTPRQITGKAVVHLDPGGEVVERSTLTLNGVKEEPPSRSPSVKRKQGDETIHEYKGE